MQLLLKNNWPWVANLLIAFVIIGNTQLSQKESLVHLCSLLMESLLMGLNHSHIQIGSASFKNTDNDVVKLLNITLFMIF